LGKYQTERDGWLLHEQARVPRHSTREMSIGRLVHQTALRVICAIQLKKGAGVALTTPMMLRHNCDQGEDMHDERVLAQPMTPERGPRDL
jgi:hypothetical protein